MKNIITTAALFLVLCASSCGEEEKPKKLQTAISVIQDETDTLMAKVEEKEIISLYQFTDERIYAGYYYRLAWVGESESHEISEYWVKPIGWLNAEQATRVEDLRNFRESITQSLRMACEQHMAPHKYSRCYQSICKEMEALSKTDAEQKTLLVFSDLNHNDEYFSLYDKKDSELARKSPKKAAELLGSIRPMPKVPGLKVYVVHRPNGYAEQARFDIAAKLFTYMWEQAGAEVFIGPNIVGYGENAD